jgi:hypothetical protein
MVAGFISERWPASNRNPGRLAIPGDGISPLTRILGKLSEKGYAGPLSVELFLPKFQQGDPYEVAREIRVKSEAIMRQAGEQSRQEGQNERRLSRCLPPTPERLRRRGETTSRARSSHRDQSHY